MNFKPKLLLITITFVICTFSLTCGCFGTPSVSKPEQKSLSLNQASTGTQVDTLESPSVKFGYKKGDIFLMKYQNNDSVSHVILVEQAKDDHSSGTLMLMSKNERMDWIELIRCKACLGKNGLDKKQEGDARTPSGDYGFLMAFGAKEDPGSLIPYTKLTDSMFLCGDKEYYNQFIDVSKIPHVCSNASEQLIRYLPQYNYALFMDYNMEHIYGKGSAIFLHCFGNYPYTMGCISISEENMVKILKTISSTARICIYSNL